MSSGSTVITIAANSGTLCVGGPAFSVTLSGDQTISNNTQTKIQLNTEVIDTNNCYDPTTNYRFTPTVAGYYAINAKILFAGTASRNYYLATQLFKNGSNLSYASGILSLVMGSGADASVGSSSIIYMNGTTDYLELYAYHYDYTATTTVAAKASSTNFNGCWIRGT